jgi:putative ABC transport system substrate-binding protein
LGYVEGENLIIERYSAEGHHERYADLAREIVTRNPDVIVTGTNPVVIAFRAATSTIPIVAFMLDPLKAVWSPAWPGPAAISPASRSMPGSRSGESAWRC